MESVLIPPSQAPYFGLPGQVWFILIPLIGIGIFTYIMIRRIAPLLKASADPRFDRVGERIGRVFKFWLGQYKHPRYLLPGILHILLFSGFLILSVRSLTLVITGFVEGFVLPGFGGGLGHLYGPLKDLATTYVLVAALALMVRRGIFKPARYAVPARYGKDHTAEAILVLGLICGLVVCDMIYDGSISAARGAAGLAPEALVPGTGHWLAAKLFSPLPAATLQQLNQWSFMVHELIFFFFLCFLPLGKHFHVITSLFNVFFMKLEGHRQAGAVGRQRRTARRPGILRRQETRKTSPGSTSWISIRASTAAAVRTTARPMPWAVRCRRGSSPSKSRDHGFRKYPLLGKSRLRRTRN